MREAIGCEERVEGHLRERLEDIQVMLHADEEDLPEDVLPIYEYGLGFGYVSAGTFNGQREAYFQWQLSWGGPGDEFRFFVNPDMTVHRIEYWFLDWFDGAHRVLEGKDEDLLQSVWEQELEYGASYAMEAAGSA